MQITRRMKASVFVLLTCGVSCATIPQELPPTTGRGYSVTAASKAIGGFNLQEVRDTLEFCLDLDSEDDRNQHPNDQTFRRHPSSEWGDTPIYDSRLEVPSQKQGNPATNGFDAFDNAWTLWKRSAPVHGHAVYAIAIRGTVFASHPSAYEDFILTTSPAFYGIEYPPNHYADIPFSNLKGAEVHTGFAYATFAMLFDKKYGVLQILKDKQVPRDSILLITGHSQGASMATLMHAFFHYAMQEDKYGLSQDQYLLKSYVFAQPKPGNVQFAMTFSEIAGAQGLSYVLNNTLDPVPLVPLTLEFAADVESVMPDNSAFWKLLRGANNLVNGVRAGIAYLFNREAARDLVLAHEEFYMKEALEAAALSMDQARAKRPDPVSQTYVSAGVVVPLRGHRNPDVENIDIFYQHHSTTYRDLIKAQLSSGN